ncbi:MAG: dihydroorotate dehydrogenase electron transfer subunit [Firmicutes bacterium]|nr:dihydroorotate dehydrogenase electron transfer subunit [Bacillota bacterium]
MKKGIFTIGENKPLTADVYRMRLLGDAAGLDKPGQFLNIRLAGKFLRRPLSVCDADDASVTVIYKVVGSGTALMAGLPAGEKLDILTGLGNGYDLADAGGRPLLIGGGVGIPPLYLLAKKLRQQGREVTAVLGFNTADELFLTGDMTALGCRVIVTTVDGSYGKKGFVTDALPDGHSYFYTCGHEPMLRAVYRATAISGQFSFEQRMGCGFGACMGCTCRTVSGLKRICKDGPVLRKEEILWAD